MIRPARTRRLTTDVPPARPALEHVADHRAEDDHQGHAADGEDQAVDEGDDEHVVAGLPAPPGSCRTMAHCVGQEKSSSAEPPSDVLNAVRRMNSERDDEDDRGPEDGARRSSSERPAAGCDAHSSDLLRLRNQLQREHDDRHQDEQHDVAGGRQAVEARLVLLVDHRRDDVGGEPRPAPVIAQIRSNERSPPISDSEDDREVAGRASGSMMCRNVASRRRRRPCGLVVLLRDGRRCPRCR